jgi:LysM repeat protein
MKTMSPLAMRRAFCILAVLVLVTTILPPVINAAPPKQGTFLYYVQYGDTLYSISKRFSTTVEAIMAANSLTNYYIYVGQRLTIPGYGPYPLTGTPFYTGTPSNYTCKYTIVSKDTLYNIAYRYQVTAWSLMQANYLYSPYIFVGQQLNVPCLNPAPTPFPVYTVQSGDNVFRIAIQYNTTIYAIALVNGLYNPNLIYVGQNLIVPYPGSYVWPTGIPTVTPNLTQTLLPQLTATITGGATATPTSNAPVVGSNCLNTSSCAVVMQNISYVPQTMTISPGTTVRWLNLDSVTHTVTAGTPGNITPNSFRSQQLGTGGQFEYTFNATGSFPYFDEIYGSQMTGTIIVQ